MAPALLPGPLVAAAVLACAWTSEASSPKASSKPSYSRPLDQIEHVVIFMQENRAYDHVYGALNGVRGFNDRTAIPLPNGLTSFYQPVDANNVSNGYMLPFHVDTMSTSAICMDAPTMDYPHDIGIWNGGRYDAWNTARAAGMGMSHFARADLPYYYALYDGFTVGDQYFQATFTQTNPNRLHLFSGSNGLSVGKMAVLDNSEPVPGWSWPTMGEILEDAGVSWKVYQEPDNFDDNGFAWFASFQQAKPGSSLYDKGMARVPDIVAAFDADLAAGTLPQVSYLIAPANQSEHAAYHPSVGEDLSARLLKVLASYPETYANTLFILNYDEGGQFFDHHWTPTAPQTQPGDGLSTIPTSGEVTSLELPVGLGFRVPLLLVSPWTRGNKVISQVFDHTSVIKFLEERFNVSCPNISPWRRAVTGNLTLALDFANPDYTWPALPDTSGYVNQSNWECENLPPPSLPPTQTYPTQETGTRISLALPYEFVVSDAVTSSSSSPTLALTVNVTGAAAAPFLLLDALNGQKATPRKYAVASGTGVVDALALPSWAAGSPTPTRYAFALHGPNGFVRQFGGDLASDSGLSLGLRASLAYDVASTSVVVSLANTNPSGSPSVTFTLTDNAYGFGGPWSVPVAAGGGTASRTVNVSSSGCWYDFTATVMSPSSPSVPVFQRRFLGRMETGVATTSDPAMANGVPATGVTSAGTRIDAVVGLDALHPRDADPSKHPLLPDHLRFWERKEGDHKDARWKFVVPPEVDM